ncbi:MAG: ribonuclease Y [Candidatus Muirbacterium halophilum]|nr:ribonuclease Y [Candidatus Muirbacterium halophilum]MCK9476082.1 ribonuclease Y [Candidatus Muirbacterium halophilum]
MIFSIISAIAGIIIGFFAFKIIGKKAIETANAEAERIVDIATRTAESIQKEAELELKNREINMKRDLEREFSRETREKRVEIGKLEKRVVQREKKVDDLLSKLENKELALETKTTDLEDLKIDLEEKHKKILVELENISKMTQDEAKDVLLSNVEKDLTYEISVKIKDFEEKMRDESHRKSREILSYAMQKIAVDCVNESTVTVVSLPSDEMKGRIIGREGRNIRALESLTGVNIIIDDTPEAVVLSSFNSFKREIARQTLERLVSDGRIHPARIEETFKKVSEEMEEELRRLGEDAAVELGLIGLNKKIYPYIGRLKFRTSYGQNILEHSLEVAKIAAGMAAEIGADVKLAKRGGLLHDIGKSIDQETEGTHVQIGVDLLKKLGERPEVINCVEAHHGDVPFNSVESVLVQTADAVSASRPGARYENIEAYIKRIEKLEEISLSFEGVEKTYALQAGREIRVIVEPGKISDDELPKFSRDIAKKIENEMDYPGEIKVVILRETKAIDYAR